MLKGAKSSLRQSCASNFFYDQCYVLWKKAAYNINTWLKKEVVNKNMSVNLSRK